MPKQAVRPERPPRGSSVWAGLDPFGDAAVSRLTRWFTDDASGDDLEAANRPLPGLRIGAMPAGAEGPGPDELHSSVLLEPDELEDGAPPIDIAAWAIQDALASLLASQHSREALSWDDREVLVPHVWLVADLDSPETEHLAEWTGALYQRFRSLNVEARVLLLLRHMSWGRPDADSERAARRCQALVETLVGDTTPGRTNAMIYVVTDRDGVGNRYSREESSGLIERSLDLLMLADLAHRGDPGAERAFQAPPGGGPDGWDTLPVFASIAGACLLWDAPAIARENNERRRAQLFEALAAPAPARYDPAAPDLQHIRLAEGGTWPHLEIPTWSPRFRLPATVEDARVRDLTGTWLGRAAEWRHAMLVTHRDRSDNLDHRASGALAAYLRDLDARERSVLDDPALPGFFAPLHRLYDRAIADLQVRREDSVRALGGPVETRDRVDAVALVKPPAEFMDGADARLVRSLERKINPALLIQVTIMTIALSWVPLAWVATGIPGISGGGENSPPFPGWPRQAPKLTAWISEVAAWAQGFAIGRVTGLLDFWDGLTEEQVWLWVGIFTIVPLTAIAVFLALRQRVVIERAWNLVYRRAGRWRDEAMRALPADIRGAEAQLTEANIAAAIVEIGRRRDLLRAFEAAGRASLAEEPGPDLAITGHIRPARAAPPPISPLVVSRIVAVFKRRCGDAPSADWDPGRLLEQLFVDAADQAGDPDVLLRDEIPLIRRRVLTSMPPDGAVRVQQLASTRRAELAPLRVARFLGVPRGARPEFQRDPARVTVVEVPVDDRFYTLVVQTGMSARRVLSLAVRPEDEPGSGREEAGSERAAEPASDGTVRADDGDSADESADAVAASVAG